MSLILYPAAAAKSLQSCPTLCDPIDGSPPDSPIPGILQARTLGWVAMSFSNAWKRKVKLKSLSCVRLSSTPWSAAYQAPPSVGFSRQEYWSGVPLPSPFFILLISTPVSVSESMSIYGHLASLDIPIYLWNHDDDCGTFLLVSSRQPLSHEHLLTCYTLGNFTRVDHPSTDR